MSHPKNHKFELVFPLIFLFFIITPKIEAQQRKAQLMGRVVNVATKAPVSFCMVFNQTSGESTYTDSLGYFKIYSDIGDTMLYSRIGYLQKELVVAPGTTARFQTIELTEHAYELKTVNIEGFGTYQQFKYKVINTPLPEAKEKINPYLGFNEKIVVLKPQASIPLGSPVTAVYMLLSKEGKSLRKLAKEEEKDKIVASYKHKYSPEVVSGLTGLKDLELEKFIKFCNIPESFILASAEIDIAERILECFKNYNPEKAIDETQNNE